MPLPFPVLPEYLIDCLEFLANGSVSNNKNKINLDGGVITDLKIYANVCAIASREYNAFKKHYTILGKMRIFLIWRAHSF